VGLRWKLRELMQQRRISNKQIADQLCVHRNTVLSLKADAPTMIRFQHLETLCQILDCQPADLFERTPERSPVTGST